MPYERYTVRKLKAREKIVVSAYETGKIKGKIESGDMVVLVPLLASVQVGDLVYCKVHNWPRVRILVSMENGEFKVQQQEGAAIETVKFEDIYGQVLEIRKNPYRENHRR